MFERYTEKARRVIFFSRYEASEFGSPEIGPEFLLLGLLREDKYVVTRWLGEGDWPTILREEVAKRIDIGPKTPTSVDLPLSNDAKLVLASAAKEAQRLKHDHIGTEHLFLGLLRDPKTVAAKLLLDRGVNPDTVRETFAKESKHSGISGGEGRTMITHRSSVETIIIREEGGPHLQLDWPTRIPAVGEILSLDQDEGKSVIYQIVKVEWNVTAISIWPPHLAKVLIYVELREST